MKIANVIEERNADALRLRKNKMARKAAWKKIALAEAEDEIIEIEDDGHKVFRSTDYHWKIDGVIDLWPSTRKYMKNGVVKNYKKLKEIFN